MRVMKKFTASFIVALAIVCISSLAFAGLSQTSLDETSEEVFIYLGWDAEETDSWSYTGTYWSASVDITDDGYGNWLVDWSFQHLVGPHEDEIAPGPLSEHSSSFANSDYGFVLRDSSTWNHPDSGHLDEWNFRIYRDNTGTPSNNYVRLTVGHVVPEPISSILFVTGGTLLAGRRFIRKKK